MQIEKCSAVCPPQPRLHYFSSYPLFVCASLLRNRHWTLCQVSVLSVFPISTGSKYDA